MSLRYYSVLEMEVYFFFLKVMEGVLNLKVFLRCFDAEKILKNLFRRTNSVRSQNCTNSMAQ